MKHASKHEGIPRKLARYTDGQLLYVGDTNFELPPTLMSGLSHGRNMSRLSSV